MTNGSEANISDMSNQGSHIVDPALQSEHQHQHAHHHHTVFAEQGHQDDVVYSNDASMEKGIVPEPSALDHTVKSLSRSEDEEAGDSEPTTRPWHRRITKHWRPFTHAIIWLLFTG